MPCSLLGPICTHAALPGERMAGPAAPLPPHAADCRWLPALQSDKKQSNPMR